MGGLATAAMTAATTSAAATAYPVNPYPATAVPGAAERHMLNRMGSGYSRASWVGMRAAGGVQAWFERQLEPASVTESSLAKELGSWFPRLVSTPEQRYAANDSGAYGAWEFARDHGNWTMLRRMYSSRQVAETMTDFWNNHLHVPLHGHRGWIYRWDYERTIRRHALGRFEDLLLATSLHPAMLGYLDNWRSIRNAPNENHGRELLELHTVGRDSGYTEEMVKHSARILSGWTLGTEGPLVAYYDPNKHTTGPVQVLGFSDANASPNGAALAERYLRYLANHPATAQMVARRLAVRFVSDTPSDALVQHLARVFTDSGTDISATLRALVATTEFRASAGQKVRTPVDDLVATVRVLGVVASRPTGSASFAQTIAYLHQGMLVYQWPRPDGAPETNPDWASASRMLSSFRMHWVLAGGYHPKEDVRYRSPGWWLPQSQLRLDRYVDHMCRMLLGRPSTSLHLQVVCQATGRGPAETVTSTHPVVNWMFPRLVSALLDTPDHMTR